MSNAWLKVNFKETDKIREKNPLYNLYNVVNGKNPLERKI